MDDRIGVDVQLRGLREFIADEKRAERAMDDLSDAAQESAREIGESGKSVDKLGSGFKTMAVAAAAGAAAVVAATSSIKASFSSALDVADSVSMFKAQMGIGTRGAVALAETASSLYRKAWGDSLASVQDAVRRVDQNFDSLSKTGASSLQSITKHALALSKAFGVDVAESSRAASQMIRTGLAKNAAEAFDLVTRGFQEGADKSGDFLDTLNEYGGQFEKFGLTGKQSIGILIQGIKAGARDTDYIADAIKEFAIRAIDGSNKTKDGFKGIGLSASLMASRIGKGGKSAADALNLTLSKLRAIEDPVKREAAAVALFGTKAEDLGRSLYALNPAAAGATGALGRVTGAAGRMADALSETPRAKFERFRRDVALKASNIASWLIASADRIWKRWEATFSKIGSKVRITFDEVRRNSDAIADVVLPAAAAVTAMATAMHVYGVAASMWASRIKIAIALQAAWNIVVSANPIGIIVLAIIGLVAALAVLYKRNEWVRENIKRLGEMFRDLWFKYGKPAWDALIDGIQVAWVKWIRPALQGMGELLTWLWGHVVKPVMGFVVVAFKVGFKVIQVAIGLFVMYWKNVLAPVFTWWFEHVVKPVWEKVKPIFKALGTFIKEKVAPAFVAGIKAIGRAWDGMVELARKPVILVVQVLNKGLIGPYNTLAKKFGGSTVGEITLPAFMFPGVGARDVTGGLGHGAHLQRGGRLAGYGGGDIIPAMLEPGETVVPKHLTPLFADAFRAAGIPGFATGGLVGTLRGGLDRLLPSVGSSPFASVLKGVPMRLLDAVAAKVGDMLSASVEAPGAPANATGVVALAKALAAARGWTGPQWDALYQLVKHESGWRNTAQNPTSTAYGLFQFLDSTWATVGARKTSDPRGQISAGLQYIAQRYGTPASAWSAWNSRSPHWYANGGLVTSPTLGWLGEDGPEMVVPLSKPDAIDRVFAMAGGRGYSVRAVRSPSQRFPGSGVPVMAGSGRDFIELHSHVHLDGTEIQHTVQRVEDERRARL